MPPVRDPVWSELVQLVPAVSLALPFIVDGKVDISRAGSGFLLGALLTIPVTTAVVARRHLLNPILLGAGLWLWLGAIGFMLPAPVLATWLAETQATGLFLGALVAGTVATLVLPHGYIACYNPDPRWIRRASLVLLGLTLLVAAWAWVFRHDVRLGGGLPFIVLNVARRLMGLRGRARAHT
jgi:hypothetical protein